MEHCRSPGRGYMSYNNGLDELGNTIEAIIDRAVSSQDFQQLNQTIRQALNSAVDTGGDAVRRALDEAAKKTEGVQDAVVNFMTQKMIVEFREGADPKTVMKTVLKNCKKVEDDCEIYL